MNHTLAAVSILSLCLGSPVPAQVTVRQGGPTPKVFRSPMIIELPVSILMSMREYSKLEFSRPLHLDDLAGYECDNVVIVQGSGRVLSPNKKGSAGLEVTLVFKAKAGMDKLVGVAAEVLVADTSLAKASLDRIDVEEGRTTTKQVVPMLRIPVAKLPDGTEPILRLTITVDDNP